MSANWDEQIPPDERRMAQRAEDQLFGATEVLAHVRQGARARMCSPYAVLGAVLARVLAELHPGWQLPPLIGSYATPNIAVVLQGASGTGKSAANDAAADLVPGRQARQVGAGSGEGLIQAFLRWEAAAEKHVLVETPQRLLYVDELAQLGGIQSRNGATIGPVLRTMITGGSLGTENAEASRKRQLPARSYRLCVVAGMQPALSDVLLRDADGGTPQRWLWLPAADALMPNREPEWPGPLKWRLPLPPPADKAGYAVIGLPDHVRQLVLDEHRKRQRGEGHALDGHAVLTRLKVAAGLAVLHGQSAVTDETWWLSGLLMAESDRSRETCLRAVAAKRADEQRARGRGDAIREGAHREALAEDSTRLAARLWQTVSKGMEAEHSNMGHQIGEGCTRRCLTHALRHHRDADADSVIKAAIDLGWIDQQPDPEKDVARYFPGDSQPAEVQR